MGTFPFPWISFHDLSPKVPKERPVAKKKQKTFEFCNKNALDGTLISEGGNECAVVVSKNLK